MKLKDYIILLFTMLKIGLFTFGGGYAMIALLQREFVEKKKWITNEEFMDMVIVAESTPGPIAINGATYVGYKVGKLLGSILCTIGVCLPSFIIIYVISIYLDRFMEFELVQYAFRGIEVCVVYLIIKSGIKMLKEIKETKYLIVNIIIFLIVLTLTILFSIFNISFSSIFYILISAFIGFIIYIISNKQISSKKENFK